MRPAAFLDRDGVICDYVDYLHKVEDFKLRPKVGEAIQLLNQNGFLVFVITNQPMIAKGFLNLDQLEQIHYKMKEDLSQFGATLDDITFCPHSPDGTISPWNIDCQCRKPKTGMIDLLRSKFSIDFNHSFLVGDTWRDIECAKKVNLFSYGVLGSAGFPYAKDSPHANLRPNHFVNSLWEAVNLHLQSSSFNNRAP